MQNKPINRVMKSHAASDLSIGIRVKKVKLEPKPRIQRRIKASNGNLNLEKMVVDA
jgi:hypothetical protein